MSLAENCVTILEFVALEIWVASAKKDALQALSVPRKVDRNALTCRGKEIHESADSCGTLVNQASAFVGSPLRLLLTSTAVWQRR